jgi:hypothetical protein
MKLSTIALAATITLTSATTFAASPQVVFKSVVNNLESQVCVAAASEGLAAAKALVVKNGLSFANFTNHVSCNGRSVVSFSKRYQAEETSVTAAPILVNLVATNNNAESKVCIDALTMGERAARVKHNVMGASIKCNNKSLKRFVRDLEKRNVTLTGF